MSTPVIYEMDSIGANGALEAVGVHPFCSTSCRDTHIWKLLGPVKTGESDMDVSGLLCEECGKRLTAYAEQFPPAKQEIQTLEKAIKLLSRVPIECITTPQIEKEIADFLALK
jgi:hypothetical protein